MINPVQNKAIRFYIKKAQFKGSKEVASKLLFIKDFGGQYILLNLLGFLAQGLMLELV